MKASKGNRISMAMALLWLLGSCTSAGGELQEPAVTPVASATRISTATPTAVPIPWPTIDPTPPRPGLGEPCEYPCWMGLVPGESTVDEVFWAVNAAAVQSTLFRRFHSDGGFTLTASVRESDRIWYRVEASMNKEGTLVTVYLKPSGQWPTLGEIVDELGEPDALRFAPLDFDMRKVCECECAAVIPRRMEQSDFPECNDVIITSQECLYPRVVYIAKYPERGLSVHLQRFPAEYPCVCREMLIDELTITEPYSLTIYGDTYEAYRWPGFGRMDLSNLERIVLPQDDSGG